MWVKKKRSKHCQMRGWGMQFVRKFWQGKRRFSLARVMAKLDNTWQTAIAIAFLVMNLSTWLRRVFFVFLCPSGKTTLVFGLMIIKIYKWGNSLLQKLIFNSAWITHRSCFWFSITYWASPKYDRIRHDNSLSPSSHNLSWTHRNLFNSSFKAFYKYLISP